MTHRTRRVLGEHRPAALSPTTGRAVLVVGDGQALGEGPVYGAAQGDLRKSLTLLIVEVTAQQKLEVDAVDLALARIAGHTGLDPVQRPALAFGVQPNREYRSGAQCRQDRLGRRRARVLPALVHGLVDQEPVRADPRLGLQVAEPGHLDRSCHVVPLC